MLVECARLEHVDELRLVLGDAMGEFVADHVESDGEAVEELPVAVAEHHLPAVPERVVVVLPVMDRGAERHALVVDRVAPEDLAGRSPRYGRGRRRPRRPRVARGGGALGADDGAGQGLRIAGGVDRPLLNGDQTQDAPAALAAGICAARLARSARNVASLASVLPAAARCAGEPFCDTIAADKVAGCRKSSGGDAASTWRVPLIAGLRRPNVGRDLAKRITAPSPAGALASVIFRTTLGCAGRRRSRQHTSVDQPVLVVRSLPSHREARHHGPALGLTGHRESAPPSAHGAGRARPSLPAQSRRGAGPPLHRGAGRVSCRRRGSACRCGSSTKSSSRRHRLLPGRQRRPIGGSLRQRSSAERRQPCSPAQACFLIDRRRLLADGGLAVRRSRAISLWLQPLSSSMATSASAA